MEAARKAPCIFEGGLYAKPGHPQYQEFENFIFQNPYAVNEYK